jgi:hypothetical protein
MIKIENARELRIGNLLFDKNNKIVKVKTLCLLSNGLIEVNGFSEKDYKGIPLTKELFLSFGGVEAVSDEDDLDLDIRPISITFSTETKKTGFYCDGDFRVIDNLKHVHQIQNLHFALTSEELVINE